jgi:hypothetical protein
MLLHLLSEFGWCHRRHGKYRLQTQCGFTLHQQPFGNRLPFRVERPSANGLARPAVPVSGVALIAFFAMQICVHPRSVLSFVLLCGFVRPLPIALCVKPQSGERVRESGWRLSRGEGLVKVVEGHIADVNESRVPVPWHVLNL